MRQLAATGTFATAQTGTVLVQGAPGHQLHIAGAVIAAAGGNTGTPSVTIRAGSEAVFLHPGVPAGGGMAIAGFDVVGTPGDSILIDCDDPGGSLSVMVAYGG